MYKVIVVDDEPLMLEGWKTMIDWRACGYELCGTATDGEEALERIREWNPDLVLTDIRMPVLDGLELIRRMKEERGVSAKVVVVSGYSEFSYAQQALRYEVDHYVLKPLVTEEIHALLRELTGPLEERRRAEASAAKEKAAFSAAAIVDLLRHGGQAAVDAVARLLGVDDRVRCRLLLAEVPPGEAGSGEAPVSYYSLQERVQTLAAACFEAGMQAWPFEDAPGRAGLFVAEARPDEEPFDVRLEQTIAKRESTLRELAVYFSGSARGLDAVPELYRQAMETRSRGLLKGRPGIHPYREPSGSGEWRLEDLTFRVGELLQAIGKGDADGIDGSVDGLLRLFEEAASKESWMRTAVQHISGELLRNYSGRDAGTEEALGWLRRLLREDEYAGIGSWSGEKLKRFCLRAAGLAARERANASAVSDAIVYLKGHYREKIQLQELAERYRLHPAFFGQQFKKETGCGFHEYIHRLRIEEACKLLRRTDMRVSDIAESLGYHDTDYFTEKFKALTGETPSSYKNKRQG